MRVYRGRADTIEADRTVSDRIVDWVADEREPAVRVWRPHRQVAFGRRDTNAAGYGEADRAARESDFPTVERSVGGFVTIYGRTRALEDHLEDALADEPGEELEIEHVGP